MRVKIRLEDKHVEEMIEKYTIHKDEETGKRTCLTTPGDYCTACPVANALLEKVSGTKGLTQVLVTGVQAIVSFMDTDKAPWAWDERVRLPKLLADWIEEFDTWWPLQDGPYPALPEKEFTLTFKSEREWE